MKLRGMGSKNCMNEVCRATTSSEWKKGWGLKSGGFATLCYKCGSAYENSIFCEKFHLEESGWRECRICGKRIHCGCIASRYLHEFMDFGGVGCISCAKRLEIHTAQSMPLEFMVPGPGSYDTSDKEGMFEALSNLEARVLSDFEEWKIPDRAPIREDGRLIRLRPRIYEDSSVLLDQSGDTAMELYQCSLLPRDKTIMMNHAHPWVEKRGAALSYEMNLCMHQLSMTCSHYKHECAQIAKAFKEFKGNTLAERLIVQEEKKKCVAQQGQFDAMVREIEKRKEKEEELLKLVEQLNSDKAELKKQVDSSEKTLVFEKNRAYDQGSKDGVAQYKNSEELLVKKQTIAKEARLSGVKDFLRSEQLDYLMLSKAVNDQHDGFYKALDYLQKTEKLDASFNVDEFANEFKDEVLLRPSFTVEDPLQPIDFPEFQPLVDALEADVIEQSPGEIAEK